jgi:hypothetical protein
MNRSVTTTHKIESQIKKTKVKRTSEDVGCEPNTQTKKTYRKEL